MKEIQLTNGKIALVDDEDYEYINQFTWHSNSDGYATRCAWIEGTRTSKRYYMHRLIMNTPKGMFTDHINRDRLDNRKSNLRICNASQNRANETLGNTNKSGKRGVYWSKVCNKWRAVIGFNNQLISLGYYDDINKASEVYSEKAKELFGDFVCTEQGD